MLFGAGAGELAVSPAGVLAASSLFVLLARVVVVLLVRAVVVPSLLLAVLLARGVLSPSLGAAPLLSALSAWRAVVFALLVVRRAGVVASVEGASAALVAFV